MKNMKRNSIRHVLVFVLMVLTGIAVQGQNLSLPVDSLIAEANGQYLNQAYQEAASLYMDALDEGYESPGLYYNLGNACYKTGQLAQAILYYEKARELAPFDEDIRNNLQMANAKIVDKVEVIPEFFLKRWWHFLTSLMQPDAWAVISLLLFVITLFCIYLFITSSGTSRFRKQTLVLGIVLFLLAGTGYLAGISRKTSISGNRYAIIMDPSVTVKGSPDALGTNVFVLHEGTRVEILDKLDDWREIMIANGSKGWVMKGVIGEI